MRCFAPYLLYLHNEVVSYVFYIRSIVNERYFYENKVLYTRIQQAWQIIQTNTFTLVLLFISRF